MGGPYPVAGIDIQTDFIARDNAHNVYRLGPDIISPYGPKSRISPLILFGASGKNHPEERCVAGPTRHVVTKNDAVDQWPFDSYGYGSIEVSASTGELRYSRRGSIVVVQHPAQPFLPPDPPTIARS